jgi:hypothetical protein
MRYFLLGVDAITSFKKQDYRFLVDFQDRWELVGFDPNKDDVTELLEHVIGWDAYLEVNENNVNEINGAIIVAEKQERDFYRDFHIRMKQQNIEQSCRERTGF